MLLNNQQFTEEIKKEIKICISSVQFSCSVMSDSLRPHESQHASLSITISWSSTKFMFIELVMPSSHLIMSSPFSPAPNPSQHQSQLFA